MSEFETNPEQALRVELADAEKGLEGLQQEYAEIQDGDLEATGSREIEDRIEKEANIYQRRIFDILTELNDYEGKNGLRTRLEAAIANAVEEYAEFDEKPQIEKIVFELFNVEIGKDPIDEAFESLLGELAVKYELLEPEEEVEE